MKKTLLTLVVLAAIGGSAYTYYRLREKIPTFTVNTAVVTRGDIVDTVGATGTLQAVTTVQVGTQVSGTIQELHADFNSLVRKGQVLARLDPSLFQTQIEQARANLVRSQADLERLKVSVDDARTKLARAKELSSRSLLPKSDLDTADVNVRLAEAQLRSAEAQVTQAQASLNQNDVNLQHTVIEAPIDGLVISRNVDVGQTVAASMQAPTLFVLAADLTKMQVVANLDESDVGRIRPGQAVSFRVDAYPSDTFTGKVSQVRLEPKTQQNVVTYATVIDVPNNELKLKPGMTANVNIEIARRSNVLRVPNSALRFRPTSETYAAIGQTPPATSARGESGNGWVGRGGQSASTQPTTTPSRTQTPAEAPALAPAVPTETATAGEGRGSGRRGGAGGDRFAERLQSMTPEEREQALQRMRARGIDPPAGNNGGAARGRGAPPPAATTTATARSGGATTIDALFGPLPRVEAFGRAWLYAEKQLTAVPLRLGISDGQNTELLEGEVQPGTALVTNVVTSTETTRPATTFPFGGQPVRGGFQGGGGIQGGGANRGRG